MADAKVSTFATKAANTCTFTYAYVAANGAYGKVAINASGGLPVYTTTALTPYADNTNALGTSALRWANMNLALASAIGWNNGSGSSNVVSYVDGVGPAFTDRTTGIPLRFDVQSLTSLRIATFPDASGTVTLRGNTVTGSGSVVLATSPALTGVPTAPTASLDVHTTQIATTAYVQQALATSPSVLTVASGGNTTLAQSQVPIATAIIDSAGTLTTYNLALEDGFYAGTIWDIFFAKAITTITWGGTNYSAEGLTKPSSILINTTLRFVWDDGNGGGSVGWFRIL